MQEQDLGAATVGDSETAERAEITIEVQQAPSPHPKPLNSLPLHNCCQTFDHPPTVPILSKRSEAQFYL